VVVSNQMRMFLDSLGRLSFELHLDEHRVFEILKLPTDPLERCIDARIARRRDPTVGLSHSSAPSPPTRRGRFFGTGHSC
jgi:hypothetical protein